MSVSELDRLEAESIHILREVAAELEDAARRARSRGQLKPERLESIWQALERPGQDGRNPKEGP